MEAFPCCERWMTAGFLIFFFFLFVYLFLHVVKFDNKENILWSTCAECLWKHFFCSLRSATAAPFNYCSIPGLQPHARGQSLVRGVLYAPLLCPQVHCSSHLAANQAYLRKLRHDMSEKNRSYDLYWRLQRDREGRLCSPYHTNSSDISWQCLWHQDKRQNCSVITCWLPVVYWHWVAYVELIPFDAFCQIL